MDEEGDVNYTSTVSVMGVPGGTVVKNPPANAGDGFDPWVGKIPWRRKWQPTAVFLPGESHEQRSLAGCSPWSRKESDTTELGHSEPLIKDLRYFPPPPATLSSQLRGTKSEVVQE